MSVFSVFSEVILYSKSERGLMRRRLLVAQSGYLHGNATTRFLIGIRSRHCATIAEIFSAAASNSGNRSIACCLSKRFLGPWVPSAAKNCFLLS